MRLFRRVPTPFAITYLVSGLLRESFQKRKADKYAAQVVHHYKPGESPYPSRTVGTLEEELERLDDTLKKNTKNKKIDDYKKARRLIQRAFLFYIILSVPCPPPGFFRMDGLHHAGDVRKRPCKNRNRRKTAPPTRRSPSAPSPACCGFPPAVPAPPLLPSAV